MRSRGALVEGAGGKRRIDARAVVLATGGFAGSLDECLARAPDLRQAERLLAAGGPGAQGEGLTIAERNGAEIRQPDAVYCYATGIPDPRDSAGRRGVIVRGLSDWIWLNRSGHRFHDESLATSGRTAAPRLLAQEGATCFAIFDAAMRADLIVADHYAAYSGESPADCATRCLSNSSHCWSAPSIDELVAAVGLPAAARHTITSWNALLESGQEADPVTGRALARLRPLRRAPFFAVQFFPALRKTLGGVRTDLDACVLARDGRRIKGLHAAGELAGFAGGHIAGRSPLEGMMVGASVFSGRIAGQAAARSARSC